jgi:hypothetical protein
MYNVETRPCLLCPQSHYCFVSVPRIASEVVISDIDVIRCERSAFERIPAFVEIVGRIPLIIVFGNCHVLRKLQRASVATITDLGAADPDAD